MREIRVSKGGGRYRVVVAPTTRRKRQCRAELPRLMAAAMVLDVHHVQHGFAPGRSPVTCAAVHRGYAYTASWDLADCFDHVGRDQVPLDVPDHCWHEDIARQGLPTSPALANIALAGLDAEIVAHLDGHGVYTRYADDLTVSTDARAVVDDLLAWLPGAVSRHGHEIATRKTRVRSARAGRREVVGVAVGADLHPTRETRRKLRAALHHLACWLADGVRYPCIDALCALMAARQLEVVRGLAEWSALRSPSWARAALACTDDLLRAAITARQD